MIRVDSSDIAFWGVTDTNDVGWVHDRLTPHPFKSVDGVVSFQNPDALSLPKRMIDCGSKRGARKQAMLDEGWQFFDLPTGHDAMVTAPRELSEILIQIWELGIGLDPISTIFSCGSAAIRPSLAGCAR